MGLRPTKWHPAALSILPPGSVVPLGWGQARVGGWGRGVGSLPSLGELSLPLSWRERAS